MCLADAHLYRNSWGRPGHIYQVPLRRFKVVSQHKSDKLSDNFGYIFSFLLIYDKIESNNFNVQYT